MRVKAFPVVVNLYKKDAIRYIRWCKENIEDWEQTLIPAIIKNKVDLYDRQELMLEEIYSHNWWIDIGDAIFKPYETTYYFKYKSDAVAFKLMDFPTK